MSDDIESQNAETEDPSPEDLEGMLKNLRLEHRRIDTEIKALLEIGAYDMLKIGRMKKMKLALKDKIVFIENQITPDIIA
ncbi:DUF465 domain-containing protein [Hellea sp.]|nr:DUF465 domain-containing protein [Hellea sp.]